MSESPKYIKFYKVVEDSEFVKDGVYFIKHPKEGGDTWTEFKFKVIDKDGMAKDLWYPKEKTLTAGSNIAIDYKSDANTYLVSSLSVSRTIVLDVIENSNVDKIKDTSGGYLVWHDVTNEKFKNNKGKVISSRDKGVTWIEEVFEVGAKIFVSGGKYCGMNFILTENDKKEKSWAFYKRAYVGEVVVLPMSENVSGGWVRMQEGVTKSLMKSDIWEMIPSCLKTEDKLKDGDKFTLNGESIADEHKVYAYIFLGEDWKKDNSRSRRDASTDTDTDAIDDEGSEITTPTKEEGTSTGEASVDSGTGTSDGGSGKEVVDSSTSTGEVGKTEDKTKTEPKVEEKSKPVVTTDTETETETDTVEDTASVPPSEGGAEGTSSPGTAEASESKTIVPPSSPESSTGEASSPPSGEGSSGGTDSSGSSSVPEGKAEGASLSSSSDGASGSSEDSSSSELVL